MKIAKVIIGGSFGDEGKGLFTDYLSSHSEGKACTVRFNGGAQAGHTVETTDGKRHVFSHFGSGSFAGLPTFLSRFFVCSPITFQRELKELSILGAAPQVYADAACPVTTPYDIMINQIAEQGRGKLRHGSVGVGFGETLERHANKKYALCIADLGNPNLLHRKLDDIRKVWVYLRLAQLEVKHIGPEWIERLNSDAIYERFIEDSAQFLSHIIPTSSCRLQSWDHLIFEGAQGLLLDQERGWFPHVTRSYTGIRNALALAEELEIRDLDVYYLTRSYTTRHGAGPLPHELQQLPYEGIVDKTNRPHAYQGSLRFAWFDADLFADTVRRDMADGGSKFNVRPHLGMSCLDQIAGNARYIEHGILQNADAEKLLDLTCRMIEAKTALASFGPTRATIRKVNTRSALRRSVTYTGDKLLKGLDIVQYDVAAAQA
jgi:adenylosuccinate synthase